MPNPADSFVKPQNNYYQSVNKRSQKRLDSTIEKINQVRLFDAIITDIDPDFANSYTVDVYERGLGQAPTRKALKAVATASEEYYIQWAPCRIMLDGDRAWIVGGAHVFGLSITDPPDPSFRNRVEGYPASWFGGVDASITHKIYINFIFPDLSTSFGPPYVVGSNLLWYKYPSPLQPSTVNPPTIGVAIQGSSFPAPTAIYQVFTPIDSSLIPIWTYARFF
jgi:hypothetical protein